MCPLNVRTGRPIRTGALLLTVRSNVERRIYKSDEPVKCIWEVGCCFVESHATKRAKRCVGDRGGGPKGRGLQGAQIGILKNHRFFKQYDIKKVLRDLLPAVESNHGNRLVMSTIEF